MKIMIVDDHPEMRRLLRSTLSHLTNEFVECTDGTEAVAEFSRHRPDWTIMDIAMKSMNGLEATRRIKARHGDAQILVLTQYDTPQMRAIALNAGAAVVLSKDNLLGVAEFLGKTGVSTPDPPSES